MKIGNNNDFYTFFSEKIKIVQFFFVFLQKKYRNILIYVNIFVTLQKFSDIPNLV